MKARFLFLPFLFLIFCIGGYAYWTKSTLLDIIVPNNYVGVIKITSGNNGISIKEWPFNNKIALPENGNLIVENDKIFTD